MPPLRGLVAFSLITHGLRRELYSFAAPRLDSLVACGEKEKAVEISLNGLYLMPATTYSPTHFRVQYNRPSGA